MGTMLALTEHLWGEKKHPDWILDSLMGHGASNRKLRLLAVAYLRVVGTLGDGRTRAAVEAAEEYADGLIEVEKLHSAQEAARAATTRFAHSRTPAANTRRAAVAVADPAPLVHELSPNSRLSRAQR